MSLQLRLWLTVVVIVVAGALVLVIGTSALYERVMLPFETVSTQSLAAVNGALSRHGAEAVDAAAAASVDPAVRTAMTKGELTPEAEAALLTRAGAQGAPTFAVLAKADGTVAAKAGDAKLDGSIAGLPVFAEASTGVARDDRFFADGAAYHLAGAPIYDGANLSGVVVLGWAYDAGFAERLTQQVGAPVVLVVAGKRLGNALAEIPVDQLNVRGVGVGAIDIKPLPAFLPLLVPDKTRYTVMSLPVFSGENQLAITIGTDRNEALRALAWAQALVIAGTLLIALLQLVLVFTVLRAVSKPIEVIVGHLSQVSQGQTVGILPEAALSGPFLRLGKQVNMILQMMPSASRPGTLSPLGSSSAPLSAPSLGGGLGGGLGGPSLPPSDFDGLPPRGAPSVGDINLPGKSSLPPSSAEPPSALSSLFDDGPGPAPSPASSSPPSSSASFNGNNAAADPLAAFRVPPKPPSAPPQPAPQPEPPPPTASMSPEATVMFQVPQELLKQSAQPASAPPAAAAPAAARAEDARTVVAQVPQELLATSAPRDGLTAADEAHYKEVYTKFVETRVQCGEDTSDLTYDRFVAKLMKNRQQIIEKHKAKSVRFQVYVKEGKAALRALPVRE